MNRLLFLDTETRRIQPATDSILEVSAVLWDIDTRSVISAWSDIVLRPMENEAESINRLPAPLLQYGTLWEDLACRLEKDIRRADVLLAHNAVFDRSHLLAAPLSVLEDKKCPPFICTYEDVRWPHASSSKSLVAIALAHGVGVVQAHRALADAMLMARLFERVAEMGTDVRAMIAYGLRPKGFFKALVPYEQRDLPKTAGFRWNEPVEKEWTRSVALDDVSSLGFPVERIERNGNPWLDLAVCNVINANIRAQRPVRCTLGAKHGGLHSAVIQIQDHLNHTSSGKTVSW